MYWHGSVHLVYFTGISQSYFTEHELFLNCDRWAGISAVLLSTRKAGNVSKTSPPHTHTHHPRTSGLTATHSGEAKLASGWTLVLLWSQAKRKCQSADRRPFSPDWPAVPFSKTRKQCLSFTKTCWMENAGCLTRHINDCEVKIVTYGIDNQSKLQKQFF